MKAQLTTIAVLGSMVAAGCGGEAAEQPPASVPAGAIAAVGTSESGVITKKTFDRFLQAQIKGTSPLGGSISGGIPIDPPGFTRCKAALTANSVKNRQPKPSAAQAKASCDAQYAQTKAAVESQLISYEWLIQEALSRQIKAAGSEINQTLNQYISVAASGGKPTAAAKAKAAFNSRLKASGLTIDDIKLQLKAQILQQKMSQKDFESIEEPSTDEAESFYNANKDLFKTVPGGKLPEFSKVVEQAKSQLKSRKLQVKQVDFQNSLQKKWRAATLCAKDYIVAQCSNGPKLPDLVPPKID